MPLFLEDAPDRSPRIVVSGSVAVELDWVMAAAWRPEFRRDHGVLTRVYDAAPELGKRARAFWEPRQRTSCGGSIELMVLAHHGGLLDCLDADHFLGELEGLCAEAPANLALASETKDDRRALLARLARLRSSSNSRRRYVELVKDIWSAVAADWERDGRAAVRAAVTARQGLERKGASWREVVGNRGCNGDLMNELVGALGRDSTITVVPAFFAHLGSLVDLPGTLMIGARADASGAQARARTELLARRLKTISDPTRLAMLESLRWSPLTISELASHFSLAQPTVSTHIKVLRDAGIVANQTEGGQRKLVVQQEALADLVGRLDDMFSAPKKH